MTVKIRPMSPADKATLLLILNNTPEFKPYEVTVAEDVIDDYLDDGKESGYIIQVAEDNNEVVGYICYGETPCTVGTWNIYWIAINGINRRKGIGKALTDFAETAIERVDGRHIFIETSSVPLYENTLRFYLARGYEVICRIPDFYAPRDDKLVLRKKL